jgi:5-methyltetrahydropteroyltriglutamate--homocysteine methyltransferase
MKRHEQFPTQEIGSLPKFSWRVKPFRSIPLQDSDLASARKWGKRLKVKDSAALLKLLKKRSGFTSRESQRIVDFSMLYALGMQETAGNGKADGRGIDIVWSGEQARTEMYETPVSNIGGFVFIGKVRAFDNKYWREASVRKRPAFLNNYHLDEFKFVKRHTSREVKVPVTDAITIMAWSDHFHYSKKWAKASLPPSRRNFEARREFTLDLARVIRRVVQGLVAEGAKNIQIDIPAATQYQTVEDAKLVAESFNESTRGVDASFSVHSCFPPHQGYALLFPYILEMKKCTRFSFEYANRDSYGRGTTPESRPGFADLALFKEYGYKGELGVGAIHVHTDTLPSVGTVRDRILYAAKATGLGPEKIFPTPDCGLRTRSPEVAYSMLGLVADGAEQAREALRR